MSTQVCSETRVRIPLGPLERLWRDYLLRASPGVHGAPGISRAKPGHPGRQKRYVNMFVLKTAIALLLSRLPPLPRNPNPSRRKTRVPYNECIAALNGDFRTEAIIGVDGLFGGMVKNSPLALKPMLHSCSGLLYSSYHNFCEADLMADMSTANYIFLAMDSPTNCQRAMKDANVQHSGGFYPVQLRGVLCPTLLHHH
ncbi:hypothetical protein CDL15_Pgr023632 [Punica granatum]|uniref:Uncharacterized protein n=1 Tax=Punica granatum TaxID=22663 RepID=A0A218W713_PUNGR|nr:hypothetical protein CDL15_Pgr023632 [Punica granatum]PKI76660.1 hypothetical protein CRG98_002969 [Punica granatum]